MDARASCEKPFWLDERRFERRCYRRTFCDQLLHETNALGIDIAELYAAQLADAELNPPEWNIQGRQSDAYNYHGYVPYGALDTCSIGRTTREGSGTLENAFEDFAIRQVALLLNNTSDEAKYANRSLVSCRNASQMELSR